MDFVRMYALAKINLALDIVGKREDGYHEVRMIMQTIQLHDKLLIQKQIEKEIKIQTNLVYLPTNENNLVFKAAELLQKEFQLQEGVKIQLEKHIPVAAGMAGGSSDAAATLVGMNKLFHLGLTKQQLMERGVKLGADVPYCILRGTALSEGIGEILTPLPPMPQCKILIVKPTVNVSTKFVYESLQLERVKEHPDIDGMIAAIRESNLYGVTSRLSNVLETVTVKEYPIIETIKNKMIKAGAINSLMSGSGSTVFGIFDDNKKAQRALIYFQKEKIGQKVFLTNLFLNK